MANDQRLEQLQQWLQARSSTMGFDLSTLAPASADASFRRYFRINTPDGTRIIMDAPPSHEDVRPYIMVAELFAQTGITVPKVHVADIEQGVLVLDDFGHQTYLQLLTADNARALYGDARQALVKLQLGTRANALPAYDRSRLQAELDLFVPWYVEKHLGQTLTTEQRNQLAAIEKQLLDRATAQPQAYVHRDYHSRNLMKLEVGNPGVLDFQDAVIGPITYDLVSLFRDAYIQWDEEQELDHVIRWWELARKNKLPVNPDFGEFYADYECMGLQRHLKVLGIFARLYHRDGKSGYLKDLPTVLSYARRVAKRYESFGALAKLFDQLEGVSEQTGYTF